MRSGFIDMIPDRDFSLWLWVFCRLFCISTTFFGSVLILLIFILPWCFFFLHCNVSKFILMYGPRITCCFFFCCFWSWIFLLLGERDHHSCFGCMPSIYFLFFLSCECHSSSLCWCGCWACWLTKYSLLMLPCYICYSRCTFVTPFLSLISVPSIVIMCCVQTVLKYNSLLRPMITCLWLSCAMLTPPLSWVCDIKLFLIRSILGMTEVNFPTSIYLQSLVKTFG